MKLVIDAVCCVDGETLKDNSRASAGWPEPKGTGHLAIVGGGPSINRHVDKLRAWSGEIWAINGAYQWCVNNGIAATFYSVDPEPLLADYMVGAEKAVIAAHCHPSVFTGPHITCAQGDCPGPTSATAAALIAINAGYSDLTYFGCESSYEESTHAYESQAVPYLIKIACNGREFLTKADMILQAQVLSKFITAAPGVFKEESGGLLRAMIDGGTDFDALAGTRLFHNSMRILTE